MSLDQSQESHESLAIAIDRMGGKSIPVKAVKNAERLSYGKWRFQRSAINGRYSEG